MGRRSNTRKMTNSSHMPYIKKGNKLECENYRGISLNVAYKIFTDVLAQPISEYTEESLGECQGGFKQSRRTADNTFTTRQILEVCCFRF
jgi:hypothetical protein